jgi:UPF0755 protein
MKTMADRTKQPSKPPKTKPRRGLLDVVNALLTLFVVAALVVGGLVYYGVHSFYAAGPIKTDTDFVVDKGANLDTIGQQLEAKGLIDNRYVFELGGVATKKLKALKAGEYKLTANASMAEVLQELTQGKAVQHGITIPEGFTIAQVVQRLNEDTDLTGELTDIPPEGGILPQTYNFEPGTSRQSVLDEMTAAQQKALADVWAGRDPSLPLSTPQQLVTLASMVEKETGLPSERAHVAAVFVNRLNKSMRLQSDPTIIYGITKGQAPLGRPLKRSEIEAKTPYNTYQVNGLPPTPIDNPGIDSLKAAANPQQSNDLYFVAATTSPADGHIFAASYADQQMNVRKLRSAEKLAAADAEADDAKEQIEAQQAAAAGDNQTPGTGTPPTPAAATPQPASPAAPALAPAPTVQPTPIVPPAATAVVPAAPAEPTSAAQPPADNGTAADSAMPDPTMPANDAAPASTAVDTAPAVSPVGSSAVVPPSAPATPDASAPDETAATPDSAAPLPMPANERPETAEKPAPASAPSHSVHPTRTKPQATDAFGG